MCVTGNWLWQVGIVRVHFLPLDVNDLLYPRWVPEWPVNGLFPFVCVCLCLQATIPSGAHRTRVTSVWVGGWRWLYTEPTTTVRSHLRCAVCAWVMSTQPLKDVQPHMNLLRLLGCGGFHRIVQHTVCLLLLFAECFARVHESCFPTFKSFPCNRPEVSQGNLSM